jgi:hypothetical protein
MTKDFRYIFYRSSRKWTCPGCGKKRFVRYIDNKTGQLLPDEYGKCDRSDSCGYWLNPYKNGYAKEVWKQERTQKQTFGVNPKPLYQPAPKREPVYIPAEILEKTLSCYDANTFISNLITKHKFPVENIKKVITMYALGTIPSGYRKGAITFPYIDHKGNIHAIQVKEFDRDNHTTGQGFIHSMIEYKCKQAGKGLPKWLEGYKQNEKRVNCFFGAHLLSMYPTNTIALVEAPKTAIYGTLFFGLPEVPANLLWLAVYNKSSLTAERFQALQGRNIVLFPDDNAYNEWSKKAEHFKKQFPGTNISISDLIEGNSDTDGGDLADYLVKMDPIDFMEHPEKEPEYTLEQLIEKQFTERMKIEYWVINPKHFPDLTRENIDMLIQDLTKHHDIIVTPDEYLQAVLKYKKYHKQH